jgi:hypothetical protein
MIVVRESSQVARQAGFTEYDHVIQELPPNGADRPLNIGSLPRRPGRRKHLFDAHGLHLRDKVRLEDPMTTYPWLIKVRETVKNRDIPTY